MEVPLQISNDLEKRIAEAFNIFDHHGDKTIDVREVGNVLRFIGCVPTEKEVNDIVKATEEDDGSGEIFLAKFLPHVSQLIMAHKMEPASPETLFEAFLLLDPQETGYISKEYFVKLMQEEGEPFTKEETKVMMGCAVDPITGNIPYEFYLNKLAFRPKDSIYKCADEVSAEIAKRKEKEKDKSRRQ